MIAETKRTYDELDAEWWELLEVRELATKYALEWEAIKESAELFSDTYMVALKMNRINWNIVNNLRVEMRDIRQEQDARG